MKRKALKSNYDFFAKLKVLEARKRIIGIISNFKTVMNFKIKTRTINEKKNYNFGFTRLC